TGLSGFIYSKVIEPIRPSRSTKSPERRLFAPWSTRLITSNSFLALAAFATISRSAHGWPPGSPSTVCAFHHHMAREKRLAPLSAHILKVRRRAVQILPQHELFVLIEKFEPKTPPGSYPFPSRTPT